MEREYVCSVSVRQVRPGFQRADRVRPGFPNEDQRQYERKQMHWYLFAILMQAHLSEELFCRIWQYHLLQQFLRTAQRSGAAIPVLKRMRPPLPDIWVSVRLWPLRHDLAVCECCSLAGNEESFRGRLQGSRRRKTAEQTFSHGLSRGDEMLHIFILYIYFYICMFR